ncbi:hypothetical protein HDK77DRAFT_444673 [Phyllosticta capitalensis]|uniref:4a-hydroxytetrahydrobiopterin dehydratase n=1 Tax=Phyllosticta capitalensis TaxID=121624 RepID=A0ABR1YMC3_9PEZI
MITALRSHAPQASYIQHTRRLASPSTLRRYHRFTPKSAVARRPYSTENDHASALDSAPDASTDVQSDSQGFAVIRGGFGDEGEDPEEDAREEARKEKARKRKRKPIPKPSQWERLRYFEPEKHEQLVTEKEDVHRVSFDLPADTGNVQDANIDPPADSLQRTSSEDLVALCTYTVWSRQEWGYLSRGFEFVDFRAARSFIIEAMQLKDELGAHMHLSNFGRYVYVRIGTSGEWCESSEKPKAWSIGDGDIDLAWALTKAAKKYMGKWQIDAAAKPANDLGYSDSWERTTRLVVPSTGRYNQVLDLSRTPRKWLTMEYRQLSELKISATEIVTALVNQIADDLVQPHIGEENMAFPVWGITDHTLAVSQTEFFCTSAASITKPGGGALQCRETVILHRNFNLEQFNSMLKKQGWSLKEVKDGWLVNSLVTSVTVHWRHCTKYPNRSKRLLNISSDTVYLKNWGPYLTNELQPSVRRVLARENQEHNEHISALPDIFSREALEKYEEAIASENEPESNPDHHKVSGEFSGLVSMLRERFDEQPDEQELQDPLGRDPRDMLVRSVIQDEENRLWRRQYLKLRAVVNERRLVQKPRTKNGNTGVVSKELINLLSKVSSRGGGPGDWRSRYYELRRSASSLGFINSPKTGESMESGPRLQRKMPGAIHWTPNTSWQNLAHHREPLTAPFTVFYHWLPGEKFNPNSLTVEDNRKQAWRPRNFKEYVTKQEREEMYQDGPSTVSAPSSLITGVRRLSPGSQPLRVDETNKAQRVELEDLGVTYLHWLPGLSFPVDKNGEIRTSMKAEGWDKELEKRREELMDGGPPIQRYNHDKLSIRMIGHDLDEHTFRKKYHEDMTKQTAMDLEEKNMVQKQRVLREMVREQRRLDRKKFHMGLHGGELRKMVREQKRLDREKSKSASKGDHDAQPSDADTASQDEPVGLQQEEQQETEEERRRRAWEKSVQQLQVLAEGVVNAAAREPAAEGATSGTAYRARPQTDEDRQLKDELLNAFRSRERRMDQDDLPGSSELSGREPEEREMKSETRSQPQASGDVSASAEAAPSSGGPSASAGAETQSTSAADAALELGESSKSSVADLDSEGGGMLNDADAEKLLQEVGISVEKNSGEHGEKGASKQTDGGTGEVEKKDGEHGEKEETSPKKEEETKKDKEKEDTKPKKSWWWW